MGVVASQPYQPQNNPVQNVSINTPASPKDTLELSNKTASQVSKKLSNTQKLLIGLGALSSAVTVGIVAVKQRKASAVKEAQKVFQDAFMRNDITMTETKQILENYKNISKIKDKEEYIRAMFKEAKKNYGFGEIDIPLNILEKMKKSNGVETMGGAHKSIDKGVDISLRSKDPINSIHHELRHMKQHYIAANYSKNEYFKALFENMYKDALRDKNNIANSYKNFEEFYKDMLPVIDDCIMEVEQMYGSLSLANVKPEQYEFAKKCIENQKNYINAHVDKSGYLNQFVEKDAYKTGDSVEKVLKKFI